MEYIIRSFGDAIFHQEFTIVAGNAKDMRKQVRTRFKHAKVRFDRDIITVKTSTEQAKFYLSLSEKDAKNHKGWSWQ